MGERGPQQPLEKNDLFEQWRDEAFQQSFKEVCIFFRHYKRWPLKRSDSSEERRLYSTITRWRLAYRNEQARIRGEKPTSEHRLDERHQKMIEDMGIELDISYKINEKFVDDVRKVTEFMDKYGREPHQRSADKEERRLGNCINAWRRGYRNEQLLLHNEEPKTPHLLSEEKQELIEGSGIVLDKEAERDASFNAKVAQVVDFMQQHGGQLPSSKKSADRHEKTLRSYVERWRVSYDDEVRRRDGERIVSTERLPKKYRQVLYEKGILDDRWKLDRDT